MLVVVAGETGGLFSETQTFLKLLAGAETRSIPKPLRARAHVLVAPMDFDVVLCGPSCAHCWVLCSVTFAALQSRCEEAFQ